MDPQYADVYYVDTRNAINDHRTGSSQPVRVGGSGGTRTVYVQPPPPPSQVVYGPPTPYATPYGFGQPQGIAANWLNRLSTGSIIDMAAQLWAALMPLPAAPIATQQVTTDVGNSILYQQALAQYAKRDEQVRTLGSLVARLIG